MRTMKITLAAAWATLALSAPAAAQPDSGAARHPRTRALAVEEALRLRTTIELTDDQISRLEVLRRRQVEARAERLKEMLELRSRIAAGDLSREELRSRMGDQREALRAAAALRGAAVQEILTAEQRTRAAEVHREVVRHRMRGGLRQGPRFDRRGMHPGVGHRARPFRGPRGFRPGVRHRF